MRFYNSPKTKAEALAYFGIEPGQGIIPMTTELTERRQA